MVTARSTRLVLSTVPLLAFLYFPLTKALPLGTENNLKTTQDGNQNYAQYASETAKSLVFVIIGMLTGVVMISIISGVVYVIYKLLRGARRILLTNEVPGSLHDEAVEAEEDRRALDELSPNDQELYFQAKDFLKLNPTNNQDLPLSQMLLIQEKGVSAWEFKPHIEASRDILVLNKTEINFVNEGYELSIQSNFPIPKGVNEIFYFECKIYELPDPENTTLELGIATKPYPYFRPPGRHRYSISYDSHGTRHYNQPFDVPEGKGLHAFPKLQQADVVGIGYRTRSGTVFFTRNGKKVSESKIGGHIRNWKNMQLYPTIGANNHCSIHVNMGSMGYVFIEANVKKWGFGPIEGTMNPPPLYTKFNGDVLLESSDIDPEDLQLRNGDFPPNFFDTIENDTDAENNEGSSIDVEEITLHTLMRPASGSSSVNSNALNTDADINMDLESDMDPDSDPPEYTHSD